MATSQAPERHSTASPASRRLRATATASTPRHMAPCLRAHRRGRLGCRTRGSLRGTSRERRSALRSDSHRSSADGNAGHHRPAGGSRGGSRAATHRMAIADDGAQRRGLARRRARTVRPHSRSERGAFGDRPILRPRGRTRQLLVGDIVDARRRSPHQRVSSDRGRGRRVPGAGREHDDRGPWPLLPRISGARRRPRRGDMRSSLQGTRPARPRALSRIQHKGHRGCANGRGARSTGW